MLTDLALLALRGTTGSLLAGHGAQKLFGSFGGPGLDGAAGMFESMGLKPGRFWATVGGATELGGGVLTALGLLHPLGPLGIISVMTMAWLKAHRGKPIWVTSGGAELPLTNIAVALAVALAGPGRLSLDRMLGIRLAPILVAAAAVIAAAGLALGMNPPAALTGENQTVSPEGHARPMSATAVK